MSKFMPVIGKLVLTLCLSVIFVLTGFLTFTQLLSYSQDETLSDDIESDFGVTRAADTCDGGALDPDASSGGALR